MSISPEKQKTDIPLKWYVLAIYTIVILAAGFIFFHFIDQIKWFYFDVLQNRNIPYQFMFSLAYPHHSSQVLLLKLIVVIFLLEILIFFILKGRVSKKVCFLAQLLLFVFLFIGSEYVLKNNNMKQIVFNRPHPAIIWENIPGYSSPFCELHFNREGFRSEEIPLKKPPQERRVLILGDSCFFGFNVPQEKTVGYRLEKLLNEKDKRGTQWRVMNSSVTGHTTLQGRYILDKYGKKLKADYVIAGYNNDRMLSPISDSKQNERNLLFYVRSLLYKSDIYLGLRKMVAVLKVNKAIGKETNDPQNFRLNSRISVEETRSNIEYIIRKSREGGTPIIVVMPTNPPSFTDRDQNKKAMKDTAEKLSANLLDLNELFRNDPQYEQYFFAGDAVHCNERGAEKASEYLCTEILKIDTKP